MRVLILEKDERITGFVEEALRQVWSEVDICADVETARCALLQSSYDAAVLGEDLDGTDSLTFLKRIRADRCQIPVLMLFSGNGKGDPEREHERGGEGGSGDAAAQGRMALSRIQALENGADYCLTMPVEEQELLAVLKAIYRRRGDLLLDRLVMEDMSLDHATFVLSGPNGSVQLGKKEFDVLRLLLVNRGIVVSKDTLLSRVWGSSPDAVDNNVEVYISFLRKKMEKLGVHVRIVTMRRLGYKLEAAG